MKKLIASAGLIAVGTAGLQAANAPGLTTQEASKPWSVAASLRGFYDDNYASTVASLKEGSAGIEFRPSVSYNLPLDQTYIGISYEYGMKYYFDRVGDDVDHQHQLDAKLDHRFSDRYRVQFDDSFVYAQEPELIDTTSRTAFRSNAEGVRNNALVDFTAQVTEVIAAMVGYQNGYYDYKETGAGSYSSLLDRLQHRFHVDGLYQVRENTTMGVGYAYWISDYRSKDFLSITGTGAPGDLRGDDRDNNSHVFYGRMSHDFSNKLKGEARVGAQYIDFSNELFTDSWSPFVDLAGYYYYLPGSYVQLAANVSRAATDFAGGGTMTDYVSDQTAANVLASVNHRITQQLTGSVLGQYQWGEFQGSGQYDGTVDNLFTAGVNLEYKVNSFWSAEVGYNWDHLDSDIDGRRFTRNRIYGGVRAQY